MQLAAGISTACAGVAVLRCCMLQAWPAAGWEGRRHGKQPVVAIACSPAAERRPGTSCSGHKCSLPPAGIPCWLPLPTHPPTHSLIRTGQNMELFGRIRSELLRSGYVRTPVVYVHPANGPAVAKLQVWQGGGCRLAALWTARRGGVHIVGRPAVAGVCRSCSSGPCCRACLATPTSCHPLPPTCDCHHIPCPQEAVRSLKGDLAQSEGGATYVVHPMAEGVSLDDSQRYARMLEVRALSLLCGPCCWQPW